MRLSACSAGFATTVKGEKLMTRMLNIVHPAAMDARCSVTLSC